MMIRAVAFDAFGTLIGYGGRRINPYLRLVDAASSEKMARLIFLTRNVPVDVFADELDRTHLLPLIRHELAEEVAGLRLFDEVSVTLRKLRTAGTRIAVCSNLAYEYGVEVHRLLPDLDAYLFSYELGVAKPDPAIYVATCTALGCKPCEVLFIGDSRRCDFEGPRGFGMQAGWLDRKNGLTLLDALQGVL